MYKSKKPKKPKSPSVEPPQLASTASEVSQPPCALETPGDATQTNNGGVTELAQAAAEADLHREKILNAISELGRLIDDWFTIAPPELHEDFDSLIRERIAALIT